MKSKSKFDEIINRKGTACVKWNSDRLLPFWVADMDFATPPAVLEALRGRLEHGVFGYTIRPHTLIGALKDWFERRYGWNIAANTVLEVPGIVSFLHAYVQHFTAPGEAVLIQEPVYYPFRLAVERNGRRVAENPLVRGEDDIWRMDIEGLEQVIDTSGARTLFLCSPHNPVGRVWREEELLSLGDICRAKGITVISDEIHGDLVQPKYRHRPWLSLPENCLPRSVGLVSTTKTFNLPGLNTAWVIVPDGDFRHELEKVYENMGAGMGCGNPLTYAAVEAAWREGGGWLDELLEYIGENFSHLCEYFSGSGVSIVPLEGTFLAWIDFTTLGLNDEELWKRMLNAGVRLSRGSQFGRGGELHLRMNLACPLSRLNEGLKRMDSLRIIPQP